MGNYRSMAYRHVVTPGLAFAALFAVVMECRLGSWAQEHHDAEARGQEGFRNSSWTTDHVCTYIHKFVLKSLIDKQKQCRQRGVSEKMFC